MGVLWAYLELLAWSVYLGGALVMELVWRPVQEHLPMSQIGVACQRMGRRYRWLALAMLVVVAVVGLARLPGRESGASLSPGAPYGRTLLLLAICWLALVGLVTLMAVFAHPALHARMTSSMEEVERDEARARVARAIRRMDRCLRAELIVALVATLLAASLRLGGI